jgi:predicted 2-oxoglutarate/Fe(II)-dependent dioxygenase YbiX
MPAPDFFVRFGLVTRRNFFDAALCAALREEMRSVRQVPAGVGERDQGYVDRNQRRTQSAEVSEATANLVRSRLLDLKPEMEKHFGLSLSRCRTPRFLVYQPGDFFAVHTDTGREPGTAPEPGERQVSVVIFLNGEAAEPREGFYTGGQLTFFGLLNTLARSAGLPLAGEEGLLVAFRASIGHGVLPVTGGERHTVVCWYS